MNVIVNGTEVIIENTEDFSPELAFECGQAFRWKKASSGGYLGIAKGVPVKIHNRGEKIVLNLASQEDYDNVWKEYFDLACNYENIRKTLSKSEKLAPAIEYGKGIRILKQDFWEALCSFIISQCNNIPRIKGIIEKLCENFGDVVEFEEETFFSFPSPNIIAKLTEEDLSIIRAGYRAKYLINAAKAVVNGEIDENCLRQMDTEKARKALMQLQGVGRKVADCVLLYGLGRMEVYPVDVWMKRVAQQFFDDSGFDGSVFGEYAGLAQQYLFHYIRGINGKTL